MSLDSSLKIGGGLAGHRNVLTRAERVAKLMKLGEFDMEADDPMGLRKVGNRKIVTGKKKKKKDAEE
ncbi:MAG: small basic protein [Phycisphaerales bacterium JB063]